TLYDCAANDSSLFSYAVLCSITLSFFFSSRRRHTRCYRDWSSDVCSSDLLVRIGNVCSGREWRVHRFGAVDPRDDAGSGHLYFPVYGEELTGHDEQLRERYSQLPSRKRSSGQSLDRKSVV